MRGDWIIISAYCYDFLLYLVPAWVIPGADKIILSWRSMEMHELDTYATDKWSQNCLIFFGVEKMRNI